MNFFARHTKTIISIEQEKLIEGAIKNAEKETSGEIKVIIQTNLKAQDVLQKAKSLFKKYKLFKTNQRNGVLIYLCIHSHHIAIYGDEGIHKTLGAQYWKDLVNKSIKTIGDKSSWVEGLVIAIEHIGKKLKKYYPYKEDDVNELSDKIELL